jgi:predicted acyl esterase
MAKFEGPDPAFWCHNNYAIINVDIRGVGYSEGLIEQFGKQDAEDGYDFIEWLAAQTWCNGKVAMAGTSALAISQWQIAALQPPHLACIAPWEGMSDMYRESLYEGGIPMITFTDFATAGACGNNGIDDMGAMARKYPLLNAYWEDKIADFSKIEVPAYVTACWNHFHLRGSIIGYRNISSKNKWLRAHREFEWPDFILFKKLLN